MFTDLPASDRAGLEARLGEAAAVHYRDREEGGPHDGVVAIADRLGVTARFVPADVTVPAELGEVFDTAVLDFGGVDVLVNNAGVGAVEGPITQCPDHLFDRVVDIDLKAVWRGIKLAAPHMAGRGGGSIISTGSVAGLRGVPGMGSYSAAKGGVIALTAWRRWSSRPTGSGSTASVRAPSSPPSSTRARCSTRRSIPTCCAWR